MRSTIELPLHLVVGLPRQFGLIRSYSGYGLMVSVRELTIPIASAISIAN